jgi:hypothetical protein
LLLPFKGATHKKREIPFTHTKSQTLSYEGEGVNVHLFHEIPNDSHMRTLIIDNRMQMEDGVS